MAIPATGLQHKVMPALVAVFAQETDRLNALDAQLGDGDHGLSMQTGLRALLALTESSPDQSLESFLREGGTAFNEAAGSTIGILVMSALKAAGQSVAGKDTLDVGDAADMLEAAISAIMARGKAKPGQKTILDSLMPAVEALRRCAGGPDQHPPVAEQVSDAAKSGAEGTVELTSSTGRARWFKDRSIGIMDPGAWSGYLIMKTVGETVGDAA